LSRPPGADQVPLIHPSQNMIVFTSDKNSEEFTDPSYHLPAFYHLWSVWADMHRERWKAVAEQSRIFLHKASHPITGLFADYAQFDGTPKTSSFNALSHNSAFDAMRTIQNVAMDLLWTQKDPTQILIIEKILKFYQAEAKNRTGGYLTIHSVDGKPLNDYRMEAHVAMNAVGAKAVDPALGKTFIKDLWDIQGPTGQYRYYNGMLYLLGLLHCSGEFKIYNPKE
ncbi:MAG: glycosyl hydrolase family 8, partial [Proteobacteria bacterium]|nr:glycosyl hydrolase family 8 [Pseudomonadota bacterium]